MIYHVEKDEDRFLADSVFVIKDRIHYHCKNRTISKSKYGEYYFQLGFFIVDSNSNRMQIIFKGEIIFDNTPGGKDEKSKS